MSGIGTGASIRSRSRAGTTRREDDVPRSCERLEHGL
jgi:hypothetical protein